jgi:hypothetical protein
MLQLLKGILGYVLTSNVRPAVMDANNVMHSLHDIDLVCVWFGSLDERSGSACLFECLIGEVEERSGSCQDFVGEYSYHMQYRWAPENCRTCALTLLVQV